MSIIKTNQENTYSYLYTYSRKAIVDFLEKKYNKKFNVSYAGIAEWGMVAQDYRNKKENLEILGNVMEHTSDIAYRTIDKEIQFEKPLNNTLFYYPEYEIAFAELKYVLGDGIRRDDVVFYHDEEKYKMFIHEANKRYKERTEKEIIVFTDTSKGIEKNKKEISQLVERKEVVLEEDVKEGIYDSIDNFFKENDTFYKKYNIPHKRGILLYGEPGNGKTTLVKSIVSSIESPVIYWQINEFTNSGSISYVFEEASKMSPVVLVIEDLDSLPTHTRSTFLNILDGATTQEGIFLIGTTNYPEKIDKALINRAGRFDRTYEIKLPSEELRFQYLLNRGTLDFIDVVEIKKIAKETDDFSFVQLNELFISMAFDFHNDGKADYEKVIKQLKENNKKSSKNQWNSKQSVGTLGFN